MSNKDEFFSQSNFLCISSNFLEAWLPQSPWLSVCTCREHYLILSNFPFKSYSLFIFLLNIFFKVSFYLYDFLSLNKYLFFLWLNYRLSISILELFINNRTTQLHVSLLVLLFVLFSTSTWNTLHSYIFIMDSKTWRLTQFWIFNL